MAYKPKHSHPYCRICEKIPHAMRSWHRLMRGHCCVGQVSVMPLVIGSDLVPTNWGGHR